MSHNVVSFFAKYIEKETGILFQDINLHQLKTRLDEIIKFEKIESLDDLAVKFSTIPSPGLKQRLLDHATNNETLFFRDPTFFTSLQDYILKEVLPTNPSVIKIWSAAASTGQEAYSIAMALDELKSRVSLPPVLITATDLSERAIAKARSAVFSDFEVGRGLSPERKQNYFFKREDGWHVKPSITSQIKFGNNNLVYSTVQGPFHIIFCRNVLIYQSVETKKKVVENLYRQLDPSGGILLGVGETMLGIKENAKTAMVGNVIFYKAAA